MHLIGVFTLIPYVGIIIPKMRIEHFETTGTKSSLVIGAVYIYNIIYIYTYNYTYMIIYRSFIYIYMWKYVYTWVTYSWHIMTYPSLDILIEVHLCFFFWRLLMVILMRKVMVNTTIINQPFTSIYWCLGGPIIFSPPRKNKKEIKTLDRLNSVGRYGMVVPWVIWLAHPLHR